MAGIVQTSMFDPQVPLPLDLRFIVATYTDINTGNIHNGMFRYVVDQDKWY